MPRPGKERLPAVALGQLFARNALFTAVCFARQNQCLIVVQPLAQNCAASVLEQEQYRQVKGGNGRQIAA
ncbi:hypothetical protein D3C72_1856120 [compost metagenome]